VQDRLRQLSVDLIQRGVTLAILEGSFLVWWLRLACAQRFEPGGFEVCLAHVSPLMQPTPPLLGLIHQRHLSVVFLRSYWFSSSNRGSTSEGLKT
jgi:hypothetical protein